MDDHGTIKSEGESVQASRPSKAQEPMDRTRVADKQLLGPLDRRERPLIRESATGGWQRAISTEAEGRLTPRRETLSSKLYAYLHDYEKDPNRSSSSEHKVIRHVRENSTVEKTDDVDGPPRSHSSTREIHPLEQSTAEPQYDRTPASDISSRVLRTWSRQLSTPSIQRQPISNIRGPRRLLTPPKSWAKWPSHTRTLRSGSAGAEDHVILRDFAIQDTPKTGSSVATLKRTKTQSKGVLKSAPRSFSNSLGRAMKQSLTKMMPTKEEPVLMKESPERPEEFLEYPELELLPKKGGYKDLQALEHQIDLMRHGTIDPGSGPRNPSTNPSLTMRLANDVQNTKDGIDDTNKAGNNAPLTISSPHDHHPEILAGGLGTTGDKLESPPSSVSYDDCVPKHMLDDNESVKSCKTVLVKRSKSQGTGQRSGSGVINNRHKYMTWHGGRLPRRQPVLLQSTIEFGAELDDMLVSARAKAIRARSAEDTQEQTAAGA